MAEVFKVIGRKKVVTKAGKDFFTYYFAKPFTQYENEHAECMGMSVEVEDTYVGVDVKNGDLVELDYTKNFQGKAVLSDIRIVKPVIK